MPAIARSMALAGAAAAAAVLLYSPGASASRSTFHSTVTDLITDAEANEVLLQKDFSFVQLKDTSFKAAFVKSLTLSATAEIFDKTWFMTLLCTLSSGALASYLGSIAALILHVGMNVALGALFSQFLPAWLLSTLSAAVLAVMAVHYGYSAFTAKADENGLKTRREEAMDEVPEGTNVPAATEVVNESDTGGAPDVSAEGQEVAVVFAELATPEDRAQLLKRIAVVFVALFIGEWGDRSQFVMISMAASMPPLAVFLGACMAVVLVCLSAVLAARLLEGLHLSEQHISGACAVSFAVMACFAIVEAAAGLEARAAL